MANFRGQDGSATVASVSIGELRSWSLDGVTIDTIEDTVKGDLHKTYLGGLGDGGSCSFTCYLDYVTGQQDLVDYFAAATPQSAAVAMVLTVDTGKTFSFNAVPQTFSTNSPEGSALVEATFNLKVSGAITVAWA
jgi:hypothetical protein